ncbi:MAG: hypothetical protein ACKVW3_04520 [Phycisphaerales bacterium]
MKKVIDWAKSHLSIVILSAVILISIPAAFIGSALWNGKIKKARQAEVTKLLTDLDASKVTYTIPALLPGDTPISWPRPAPNADATAYFKGVKNTLEEQIGQVASAAQRINGQGHLPLISGLFPQPVGNERIKALELASKLVGKGDEQSVYQDLLDSMRAGEPADPIRIAASLEEQRSAAIEKARAEAGRDRLTPEEEAELTKKLVALRIGQYQVHAGTLSVYATMDNLPPEIPRELPTEPPTVDECFEWQFDYWVVQDICRAIAAANTGENGLLNVDRAVAKRLISLNIERLGPTAGSPLTGRSATASNQQYDVRNVTMDVVVSSSRLPELVNAISRTNFMTVIDVDLSEVDVWQHLEEGYYYGPEHVVQASLGIETVWLRSWTTMMMPENVKNVLAGVASDGSTPTPMAAPEPMTSKGGRGGSVDEPPRAAAPKPTGRSTKRQDAPGGGGGRKQRGGGDGG